MNEKIRAKSHNALRWIIIQKSQIVSYAQYFKVCPETHFSRRLSYLQEQRDISPFVTHRFKKYAYFKTSSNEIDPVTNGSKYEYQRDILEGKTENCKHIARDILTVDEIDDEELLNATRGEISSSERRVIIMNDQELQLESEIAFFFDPNYQLKIAVKDIDGYFSFYHDNELLKTSKKLEGTTRIIEEKIISSEYLDIPCVELIKTRESKSPPETLVRGSLTSIREFISKALMKEFPMLSSLTQAGKPNVIHDDLLDLYAPYIENNCLIKLPKTQFIIITST